MIHPLLPRIFKNTYPSSKNGIRSGVKGICPPITLNEQILPTAQSTRYLGIIIDQLITMSPHLCNKLLSLNNPFRLLRSLLTSNHIKLPIKLLIYKLYLKPMWTYGI
ncbi:ribosome biogenesis protein TSR3 isoform X1 [Aphis craccivora]|uniref:Ribosome biogenesis protein TSR3 isoform X1 n=1 Tax=Aphis craccivora TaxID=307492 RepID=A0A6G0VIN9_APHCR|nr:ribosome biogenesis protein TSR3 isoform X1 [Aphis craccivora]